MMDGKVSPGEVTRNFYRKQGATEERERIMEFLVANKVLRIDALGSLVFVNCDTLEVEYLRSLIIPGN